MAATKVAVTIDTGLLTQIDALVKQQVFRNRSKAIQEAVQDKLARLKRTRLARECAKLNRQQEQALAEEGMEKELESWPEY
jgi:metal-responsive CopG/Arc/MetJ family transcriptional regulator